MFGFRISVHRLLGLVLVFFVLGVVPAPAQTSLVCEQALSAAEEQYRDAAYGEALRLVSACLNQTNIPQEQAVSAYRLLDSFISSGMRSTKRGRPSSICWASIPPIRPTP